MYCVTLKPRSNALDFSLDYSRFLSRVKSRAFEHLVESCRAKSRAVESSRAKFEHVQKSRAESHNIPIVQGVVQRCRERLNTLLNKVERAHAFF